MGNFDRIPIGKHCSVELPRYTTVSIGRLYPNAWHLNIQVSKDVWIRCDGEEPQRDGGFLITPEMGIVSLPVCGNDLMVTTEKRGCIIQYRWMGMNGNLPGG